MHLKFNNVNDAFYYFVERFQSRQGFNFIERKARDGSTCVEIDEPVIVTYSNPKRRVLFNEARDANPFFHLFEAMWMLAGSNKLEPLLKYVSTFGQFSDDGKILNGAYGYRWRNHVPDKESQDPKEPLDQLDFLIELLRETPSSRRAVLQMWNVEDDLLKVDSSKDLCCNTAVYFSLREVSSDSEVSWYHVLDMTVTNRSNDLIWGMLGANYVHFTFLQEYVANCLGVEVGCYTHMTNNLHIYEGRDDLRAMLEQERVGEIGYESHEIEVGSRLLDFKQVFDFEVKGVVYSEGCHENPTEPFLKNVVVPAIAAFSHHKERDYKDAIREANKIESDDWKRVCVQWLVKRAENWEKKNA